MSYRAFLILLVWVIVPAVPALELDAYRPVDLSHAFNGETIYWPTSPSRFEKERLAFGRTEGGWFYSAYSICTPEHGGTHSTGFIVLALPMKIEGGSGGPVRVVALVPK